MAFAQYWLLAASLVIFIQLSAGADDVDVPPAVPTTPAREPTTLPTARPSTEPTEPQRDCDTFAIDDYLEQCSAVFAENTESVATSIEDIESMMGVIQNEDLPAMVKQSANNAANISDLAGAVGEMRESTIPGMATDIEGLDGRLETAETTTASNAGNIADLVAEVAELRDSTVPALRATMEEQGGSLSASLSSVTDEVSVLRDSSIPDIESEVAALDERLAAMEDRLSSFERRRQRSAAAMQTGAQIEIGEASPNELGKNARYKDGLVLALLASNLALLTYMACSCKSSRKGQYAKVYLSDAHTGEDA